MIRFIAVLFLGMTVLAGLTIGTGEIALVNAIVFIALALVILRFARPRWGDNGAVYGMAGAFFVSLLWPYVWMVAKGGDCVGDACLAGSAT